VRGYGEPADSARIRAEIAEAERQPPPSETVESLLSTPFPTAEEAALYLGEWVGEETTPGGTQPRKVIIQVEGGHVVAYRITYPNGTEVKSRLRYLTVGKGEFTFGFVNGMRPYGMLLYTMRRNGDRFEGEQRWGGVRVTYPDGVEPPRFSVVLRKSGG
jgi:hypothetical protein